MAEGSVHIAKCWECRWSSPVTESAGSAELHAGWHAIECGCPIGRVRTIRTSEVAP